MSAGAYNERAFEDRVDYELLRLGWEQASGLFSAELGTHTGALWEFVGRTQIKKWNKLIELYGGGPDVAPREVAFRGVARSYSPGRVVVLRPGRREPGRPAYPPRPSPPANPPP